MLRQDPALFEHAPLPEPSAVCPYRGLLPYDTDNADTFFGRSDDVGGLARGLAEGCAGAARDRRPRPRRGAAPRRGARPPGRDGPQGGDHPHRGPRDGGGRRAGRPGHRHPGRCRRRRRQRHRPMHPTVPTERPRCRRRPRRRARGARGLAGGPRAHPRAARGAGPRRRRRRRRRRARRAARVPRAGLRRPARSLRVPTPPTVGPGAGPTCRSAALSAARPADGADEPRASPSSR